MGGLAGHLRRVIAAEGPITVARYMEEALGHPRLGYYMRGDPFGARGDFVTAPEISQIFGELVGLWCAVVWRAMGRPAPVLLVELGPGRGTLMADALRAVAGAAPDFRAALAVHLVETSPALKDRQRAALAEAAPRWHRSLESVPEGPMLAVANEFFDALPVRQFERTSGGWRERLVGVDSATGVFRFQSAPRQTPEAELILPPLAAAAAGSIVESRPAADELAKALARRVAARGGAALVVDYGPAHSAPGDSLQAVKAHRYHDALEAPGEADLTAHVDFAALARAAGGAGARVHGPVAQGRFLSALGIDARAAKLLATATAD